MSHDFPIRIWTFNNPLPGISDQLYFMADLLYQHKIAFDIDNEPDPSALNILIEHFNEDTASTVRDFCYAHAKKVAIILTEHIDFIDRKFLFHGRPLGVYNDYMAPSFQIQRLKNLLELQEVTQGYLALGDLPRLINFSEATPLIELYRLSYPLLNPHMMEQGCSAEPEFDFCFCGGPTAHRAHMLDKIRQMGFSVCGTDRFISVEERDKLIKKARIVLNIPQDTSWQWLSPLRTYAALRQGKATLSIGTKDNSEISKCCPQILQLETLSDYVANWRDFSRQCHRDYNELSRDFSRAYPFPKQMFELWALCEL